MENESFLVLIRGFFSFPLFPSLRNLCNLLTESVSSIREEKL